MERKQKPSLACRALAYLAAAIAFTVVTEIVLQAITLVKTGEFMPFHEAHIACMKFTFFFLLLAGFIIVSFGHFSITLSRIGFKNVKKRHSYAYAIGYIIFVMFGVVCTLYSNPNIADQMASGWWVYILSAVVLFFVALIAGKTFAHVYEYQPKLS